MSENENAIAADQLNSQHSNDATATESTQASGSDGAEQQAHADAHAAASTEEITYHAVEKDGQVTAIWEMQGRKHLRTIDPRSRQGEEILRLYTAEHHDEPAAANTTGADASAATESTGA